MNTRFGFTFTLILVVLLCLTLLASGQRNFAHHLPGDLSFAEVTGLPAQLRPLRARVVRSDGGGFAEVPGAQVELELAGGREQDQPAKVAWDLSGRPPHSAARLQSDAGLATSLVPDVNGRYVIELKYRSAAGQRVHQRIELLAVRTATGALLVSEIERTPAATLCAAQTPVTLRLDTVDEQPVTNRTDWIKATLHALSQPFDGRVNFAARATSRLQVRIRGRGNSTFWADKKPFVLRVSKADRSQREAARLDRRVFLANYYDPVNLRNALAFCLGRHFSAAATPVPQSFPAELIFNRDYQGLYQVSERPFDDRFRAAMRQHEAERTAAGDGSAFFVERTLPERIEADKEYLHTALGSVYRLRKLAAGSADQARAHLDAIEHALVERRFDSTRADWYGHLLDVDAAVDYVLLNELFKDYDRFTLSAHAYRPDGGKLVFGPLWDFDLAMGNYGLAEVVHPQGWFVRRAPIANHLFADPAFRARVRARHADLLAQLPALLNYLYAQADAQRAAQDRDARRWGVRNVLFESEVDIRPGESYDAQVDYLASWLLLRAHWMSTAFAAEQQIEAVAAVPQEALADGLLSASVEAVDADEGRVLVAGRDVAHSHPLAADAALFLPWPWQIHFPMHHSLEVEAVAAAGFEFAFWEASGTVLSLEQQFSPRLQLAPSADLALAARFVAQGERQEFFHALHFKQGDDHAVLRAAGFGSGDSFVDGGGRERLILPRGLNLIGFTATGHPHRLRRVDACFEVGPEKRYSFQRDMDATSDRFVAFAVLAHDSAFCPQWADVVEELFAGTAFSAWTELDFRMPYVGVRTRSGAVRELVGKAETALIVEMRGFLQP